MSDVSFKTQILPLFTAQDIKCMAGNRVPVYLDNYGWMSVAANAQNVYGHLTGTLQPQMPLGETLWTSDMQNLFHQWITDGLQP